eukprot:Colp12_sorted_trinity150504_noHs@848
MDSLKGYGSSGEDSDGGEFQVDPSVAENLKKKMRVDLAPSVVTREEELSVIPIDPHAKQLSYNPKYDELFAAQVGPENPNKTAQQKAKKNILTGYVEPAHMSEFDFEEQRRTFQSYGYAMDPTAYSNFVPGQSLPVVGDIEKAQEMGFATVFDRTKKRVGDKRKREDRGTVDDISNFNNDGTKFLSCGYDNMVKLWDTETGQCISKFTNNRTPYCCKFNPKPDRQHMICAGTSDKKIMQWDINTGQVIQEYDRHLGPVNSITFVDGGDRFVTTSDDRSIRVWEWEIPVDIKYIADPGMHAISTVSLHPNGNWFAGQSNDNQIVVYSTKDRFRQNHKKTFKGHNVASYACGIGFSPDGSYICSGDSDGYLNIWDWKSTRRFSKFKAHQDVVIDCAWLPHETSKLVTAGWDGLIKLWD